jgi:GNAT superfamily N-acetyltransferase
MGNRPNAMNVNIRFGLPKERADLEGLQRRASLKWEDYRADLLANPDAIQLPLSRLQEKRVRVAELSSHRVGFSVVIPKSAGVSELDGLFVEPEHWGAGIGRALLMDAVRLARDQGATVIEMTANPRAEGFYEKFGFIRLGYAQTQFGPARQMRYLICSNSN